MARTAQALQKLRDNISSLESAVIAFSGGADSSLVAKVAKDVLGERAVAVTVDSPLIPREELRAAERGARAMRLRHVVVRTDPLGDPAFSSNPVDRCYLCKLNAFGEVRKVADKLSFRHVVDGSNADDEDASRPGSRARDELGVRSPLAETGIGKDMAMRISRSLELHTHSKEPTPCLATRVPYGETLTPDLLMRIERAEDYLARKGFTGIRVRAHGNIARIEISPSQIQRMAGREMSATVVRRLKSLGFAYVTMDLEGYRSGSMDEVVRG